MRIVGLMILIKLVFADLASAQQKPHYSQYFQNMSVINPAVTGMLNGTDMRVGVRSQWNGFEGAPKTGYVSLSTPISLAGDLSTYTASDLGVIMPESKDDMFDYIASNSHHAIGALALSDKSGPLNKTTINFTYAYHLALGDRYNLAFGLGVGVNRLGLNAAQLVFEEADDPVVGTSKEINKYTPDLNLGMYLYTGNLYLGASMQQVLSNKIYFDGSYSVGKDVAHYFITAGYGFWLSNDFIVTPSVMVKNVKPLPNAFDLNLKFSFREQIWLGGGYRKNDSYFANLGFSIQQTFDLSYSFDFTQSNLRTVSSGSHELALRVLF